MASYESAHNHTIIRVSAAESGGPLLAGASDDIKRSMDAQLEDDLQLLDLLTQR